jgi:predicted RNase H-like nuclease (RuvC/YqgF family)
MMNKECVQLVASEYSKLQGAIDDLGTSIGNTLGQQKQDLERAYKSEMRKVKVEIESLTKDKNCLEESIMTNERACQLEIERDWYKKEALHLDEEMEKMKVRQRQMIESKEDREWMKGRLRKLTENNAVLEKKLKELGVDVGSLLVGAGTDAENMQSKGDVADLEGKSVSVNADDKEETNME